MNLRMMVKKEHIEFVINPRMEEHFGDGYHVECIAQTLEGEEISIEDDFVDTKITCRGKEVYLARKLSYNHLLNPDD